MVWTIAISLQSHSANKFRHQTVAVIAKQNVGSHTLTHRFEDLHVWSTKGTKVI